MIYKRLALASIIAGGLFIIGCGPTMIDQNWSRSLETARFNQTLNPEAENNHAPVTGMDGQSAANVMDTYRKSFSETEQPSSYDVKLTGIGMKQ